MHLPEPRELSGLHVSFQSPITIAGKRYAAWLKPETSELVVDCAAPISDVVEAILDAGRHMERIAPADLELAH